MGNGDQAETVPLKLCRACGVEIRERDRFCRRCGAGQSGRPAPASTRLNWPEWIQAASGDLSALTLGDLCHPVSGPLVSTVTTGISANTSARLDSRAAQRVIQALISVPVWLIIVLLSPFDAYAAAKAVARHF